MAGNDTKDHTANLSPSNSDRKSDGPVETVQDVDRKPSEAALTGELISAGSQHLHRKLGGKEIQLFAIGGAIGTCMKTAPILILQPRRRSLR